MTQNGELKPSFQFPILVNLKIKMVPWDVKLTITLIEIFSSQIFSIIFLQFKMECLRLSGLSWNYARIGPFFILVFLMPYCEERLRTNILTNTWNYMRSTTIIFQLVNDQLTLFTLLVNITHLRANRKS